MNVGIIGCGKWCIEGEIVKHWISAGVTISALCDLRYLNASRLIPIVKNQGKSSPKIYSGENGFVNMLDHESLDAVVILTPPYGRVKVLEELISRNMSFYVEKPLCANQEEAFRIYDLYKKKSAYDHTGKLPITGTALAGRSPAFICLRQLLNTKEYGNLIAFHFNYAWKWNFHDGDHWRGKPQMGGGHIKEKLIHHLEALNWSLGPFRDVMSSGIPLRENPQVWNNVSAIFNSLNISVLNPIHISASFGLSKFDIYTINACFEKKRFYIYKIGDQFISIDEHNNKNILGDDSYWWPSKNIQDFVNAYKQKILPQLSLKDAYEALILADAFYSSLGHSKSYKIDGIFSSDRDTLSIERGISIGKELLKDNWKDEYEFADQMDEIGNYLPKFEAILKKVEKESEEYNELEDIISRLGLKWTTMKGAV